MQASEQYTQQWQCANHTNFYQELHVIHFGVICPTRDDGVAVGCKSGFISAGAGAQPEMILKYSQVVCLELNAPLA